MSRNVLLFHRYVIHLAYSRYARIILKDLSKYLHFVLCGRGKAFREIFFYSAAVKSIPIRIQQMGISLESQSGIIQAKLASTVLKRVEKNRLPGI
jgi:hypothetical protein